MIGIIGGSGVEEISELADATETKVVETEYGSVEVSLLSIGDKTFKHWGQDSCFLAKTF